ncbi:MAG TPA: hypothetical protein VKR06_11590 [Ktedonosporobacter sp.]|nr:hypothetical protein [Ktedonosporobacter sp.]
MLPARKPTILLIEADTSLRRLITLGLQHRDMQVIAASSLSSLPATGIPQPDLLVLDLDNGATSDPSSLALVQSDPHLSSVPAVVLAWDAQPTPTVQQTSDLTSSTQCLAKPFDARALHRSIDQLLAEKAAQEAAAEARAEALLLASYSAQTSPSLLPFITAAGLLLAVIGMLFQVAIVATGMLIVLAALLFWAFGIKPSMGKVVLS